MKKNKKGLSTSYSRDDLLGFSTKLFSLNQSEYVAKKIIDQILYKTFDILRKKNVKKMDVEYTLYNSILNLKSLVNLGILRPEVEFESQIKYDIDFEIKPNKIDSWASNYTKILSSLPPKEIPETPPKKLASQQGGGNKDRKYVREKSRISISKIKERSSETSKNNNLIDKNGKVKNFNPREGVPMDNIKDLQIEAFEEIDPVMQLNINYYRVLFQEKAKERQKRKILEKEQEERAKEEEKKIKQVMQLMSSSSLASWDAEGRFLPIKPLAAKDFKNYPDPRKRINEKKMIYDDQQLYNLNKETGLLKSKLKVPDVEQFHEVEEITTSPKFYQPNPITSFTLSKGVDLDFYGAKKKGGHFNKGDGRMTLDEFQDILSEINPYGYGSVGINLDKVSGVKKVKKGDEKNLNSVPENEEFKETDTKQKVPSSTRLYNVFRNEIVGRDKYNTEEMNKMQQSDVIKEINIKNPEENEEKEVEDKIEKTRYKLEDVEEINEDTKFVFNELIRDKEVMTQFNFRAKVMPSTNVHESYKNDMKKSSIFSRERKKNDAVSNKSIENFNMLRNSDLNVKDKEKDKDKDKDKGKGGKKKKDIKSKTQSFLPDIKG